MWTRTLVIGVVVVSAIVVPAAHSQSSSPWAGVWKLNLAKSKYHP